MRTRSLTPTRSLALVVASLGLAIGCDQGAPNKPTGKTPTVAPAATVTLTAVAFADDCGGTPPAEAPVVPASVVPAKPSQPPAAPQRRAIATPADEAPGDENPHLVAKRRCEQTAMQLAINATRDTEVAVKTVEVFDDRGTSVGVLTASKPTRWSDAQSAYEAWDGKVAAGQAALVSYVLSQPTFVDAYDERDRTYTVKVIASVGGIDQPLQTTVMVVGRPPPVPT